MPPRPRLRPPKARPPRPRRPARATPRSAPNGSRASRSPARIDFQKQYSTTGELRASGCTTAILMPIITVDQPARARPAAVGRRALQPPAQPGALEDQPQHADRGHLDARAGADPGGDRGPLDHAAGATSSTARPKDALTIKATGYQWYWGYTYPDNGGFEVISNMLPDEEADEARRAAAPRRRQPHGRAGRRAAAHPGDRRRRDPRLRRARACGSRSTPCPAASTRRTLTIDEPGIYYGQCSELCGARHGYMPIARRGRAAAAVRGVGPLAGRHAAGDAAAAAPAAARRPRRRRSPNPRSRARPAAGAAPPRPAGRRAATPSRLNRFRS